MARSSRDGPGRRRGVGPFDGGAHDHANPHPGRLRRRGAERCPDDHAGRHVDHRLRRPGAAGSDRPARDRPLLGRLRAGLRRAVDGEQPRLLGAATSSASVDRPPSSCAPSSRPTTTGRGRPHHTVAIPATPPATSPSTPARPAPGAPTSTSRSRSRPHRRPGRESTLVNVVVRSTLPGARRVLRRRCTATSRGDPTSPAGRPGARERIRPCSSSTATCRPPPRPVAPRPTSEGSGTDGKQLTATTVERAIDLLDQAELVNLLVVPPYTKGDTDAGGPGDRDRRRGLDGDGDGQVRDAAGTRWPSSTTARLGRGRRRRRRGRRRRPTSANAALYFPRIRQPDPLRPGQIGDVRSLGRGGRDHRPHRRRRGACGRRRPASTPRWAA